MIRISTIIITLIVASSIRTSDAFTTAPRTKPFLTSTNTPPPTSQTSLSATTTTTTTISLTLEKPLGIILEEVETPTTTDASPPPPRGVIISSISENGSAHASSYRDSLAGCKITRVMDNDVTTATFERVMDLIVDAPSPVTIDVEREEIIPPRYEVGCEVVIKVMQEGVETKDVAAKVGDNLRQVLLANDVKLYRGMKKTLGNCGGGGQCTFCAVDFLEEDGWEERSEYEDGKIGKKGEGVRLACLNNIQGPATIRVE